MAYEGLEAQREVDAFRPDLDALADTLDAAMDIEDVYRRQYTGLELTRSLNTLVREAAGRYLVRHRDPTLVRDAKNLVIEVGERLFGLSPTDLAAYRQHLDVS